MKNFICFVFIICLAAFCFAQEVTPPGVIKVEAGKNFEITLEANATTGYQWQIADSSDRNLVQMVSSEYFPERAGRVGVGGEQVWVFKALNPGEAKIDFKYLRAWEDKAPEKEASFTIVITE